MKAKNLRSISLIALLGLILASSCTRYKNLVLLQEEEGDTTDLYTAIPPNYLIQQRDLLYIRVSSLNQEITKVINSNDEYSRVQFTNDISLFIYGYDVSDSGFVEIPIIGKVSVANKTMAEAKIAIEYHTAKFLKDATVVVKLISFKYSVIGEVNRPGVYQNYNLQLTVLEAISKAGNISPFGERRKILVIRPSKEGSRTFRLDLTSDKILESEGFFLLPNDVVYVEPVKSYNFRNNLPIYALFFSAITTFILVLNYINPK